MAATETQAPPQAHDLLILTDATASMTEYLASLTKSLPDIIRISTLTNAFARIGVLAYRDYLGNSPVTEWSGWCVTDIINNNNNNNKDDDLKEDGEISEADLLRFVAGLVACEGGDLPEAAKTGLALAYQVMRADAKTVILVYADAPPHMPMTGGRWRDAEMTCLTESQAFKDVGPLFVDWRTATKTLATSEKQAQVFAIIHKSSPTTLGPFAFLCTLTGGNCYELFEDKAQDISDLSMCILLTWMGLVRDSTASEAVRMRSIAQAKRYRRPDPQKPRRGGPEDVAGCDARVADVSLPDNAIAVVTKPRQPAVEWLPDRYAADPGYRDLATLQLHSIIKSNVVAITANPVFGSLWRAVCNDRENRDRDKLAQEFSLHVDKIEDPVLRIRMSTWLEASYDFGSEIRERIASVPADQRYPCIYLDPTQQFAPILDTEDTSGGSEEATGAPPAELTRAELLEIGRSCDARILGRLGKILTRLTVANSEDELPAHIKAASEEDVPRIPLALASPEHNRSLWKCLLHLVIPGTQLAMRPATLLAALSNRMGMVALRGAADEQLIAFRQNWAKLDVPENWSVGCLSLLLDTDRDYEQRIESKTTTRLCPESSVLRSGDRALFQILVDYKMLEFNLDAALSVRIGWRPDKTKVAIGPVVICKSCKYPRSVTVMSDRGVCGLCSGASKCPCKTCKEADNHKERQCANVTEKDNEHTEATWVECSTISCRAQYVVYNPSELRIRPKCFFCRHQGKTRDAQNFGNAPWVECSGCLSRVIWPKKYRPQNFHLDKFKCPACDAGKVTIIEEETTPKVLSKENGKGWLLRNDGVFKDVFNGRSLFHAATNTADLGKLVSGVEILPRSGPGGTTAVLTYNGKLIRNVEDIYGYLQQRVSSRTTGAQMSTCLLCFADVAMTSLRTCGRTGCVSVICPTSNHLTLVKPPEAKKPNHLAVVPPQPESQPSQPSQPESQPSKPESQPRLPPQSVRRGKRGGWKQRLGGAKQNLKEAAGNGSLRGSRFAMVGAAVGSFISGAAFATAFSLSKDDP